MNDADEIEALVDEVKAAGWAVASRYGDTTEILEDGIRIPPGTLVKRDGVNWSLGWMEMLQLLAGVYDFEALKRIAPKANLELFTREMAYGPRVVDQMLLLIDKLEEDPDTRQAIVFVAKPEDGMTSNLPCTLTMQFLIRRERLQLIVSMRSWDLCRGLPYDIMMFSGLQMAVARCLFTDPGYLTIRAGSVHIYDELINKTPSTHPMRWRFKADMPTRWDEFQTWARLTYPELAKGETPWGIELYSQDGQTWT